MENLMYKSMQSFCYPELAVNDKSFFLSIQDNFIGFLGGSYFSLSML